MKNSFHLSKRIFLQHWFDNGISQLITNQNLHFENLVVTCSQLVYLSHSTMFTYSHATTPFGQSERAYYLSYFITCNNSKPIRNQHCILFKQKPPFLYFYFLITFIPPFFCICFTRLHFIFHPWKAVDRQSKAYVSFLKRLARECLYCILTYCYCYS